MPVTSTITKQTEPSTTQRSSRPVPKAPTSQAASVSSDTVATSTPTKSEYALYKITLSILS